MMPVDLPDGGQIRVDLSACVEFPLSDDGRVAETLFFDPVRNLWILWTGIWGLAVVREGVYRPQLRDSETPARVVTPAEARKLRQAIGQMVPDAEEPRTLPHWDPDRLRLTYGTTVCRQYKRRNAPNHFQLLDAFAANSWPRTITSPFSTDRTLRETIKSLNASLIDGSPIRFAVEDHSPVWLSLATPCDA
jgi:hypothetical protein